MTNQKLNVTRTLGFEIEGFVYDSDMSIGYATVGWDGSLQDGDGDAVEVRTEPINNLNLLEDIYDELADNDFNVNDTCGLHIHVDTSDFSVKDKAKLLRFGAGIELLMYALVDETRESNTFCTKIHKSWRKIFRDSYISQPIDFSQFEYLDDLCGYVANETNARCWNGKYQWLNANVESYDTVEFRIFNATEDSIEVQRFGMLAYHIVETVKNSSVKQLSFIIKSLYESTSVSDMHNKLFEAIGLDEEFRPCVSNQNMVRYLDEKFCQPNRELAEQEQAV